MKSIINGLFIALEENSDIPVPKVERNNKNMRYAVCFFPVTGVIIGALLWGWFRVCSLCGFGQVCFALAGTVIPLFITGGIYIRGFMNTTAALHAGNRNGRKKGNRADMPDIYDAVVTAGCFFLLYGAGMTLIRTEEQILLLSLTVLLSQTLYGMSLMWFKTADKEGNSYVFFSSARLKTVRIVLVSVLALGLISAVFVQPVAGAVMALAAMWIWTYYYYMTKKRFGGITDDTAGFFVCLCDLVCVLLIGMIGNVM